MACMFTMMNEARLAVGLQGVAIAETATQQAMQYARERRQGRERRHGGDAIGADHRACRRAPHADDHARRSPARRARSATRPRSRSTAAVTRPTRRARAAAHERASLLTPVAKAFSTDIGSEVASLGVQVHGGMGYIEETGAAQHYRDARIAQIYEGTNGIQAIDLVTRKLPLVGRRRGRRLSGRTAQNRRGREGRERSGLRRDRRAARRGGRASRARHRVAAGASSTTSPKRRSPAPRPICGCSRLAAGGCMLADEALAALRLAGEADAPGRVATARFFAENLATAAGGLATTVTDGAGSIVAADAFG